MADSIQLTDLDVIARYSIAVRSATADRDELLETLRADVAWLERGRSRTSTSTSTSTSAFRPAGAEVDDAEVEAYEEPETPARPKRTTSAKRTTARRTPRA